MKSVDDILRNACEDQREALLRFHRSGSLDDCVGVHFDACLACERAIEELIALRDAAPQAERPIVRPRPYAAIAGLCLTVVAIIAFFGAAVAGLLHASGAAGTGEQSRIRYVRMPGYPNACVATIRGSGGYGPAFIGATRCAHVHDRVEFDEAASFDLGRHAVVPIVCTSECLATAEGSRFTFPCGD